MFCFVMSLPDGNTRKIPFLTGRRRSEWQSPEFARSDITRSEDVIVIVGPCKQQQDNYCVIPCRRTPSFYRGSAMHKHMFQVCDI